MFDRYEIKSGDSLSSIAKKFNTTESMIKDINNIAYPDMLRAGMDIIVPKGKENYFGYYKIEKGDSLYKIGMQYNINPELLAALNGLNMDDFIYPGQEILIPKSGYSYYITKEGDTLDVVADRFKTDRNTLLRYNDVIYMLPGQLLVNKTK